MVVGLQHTNDDLASGMPALAEGVEPEACAQAGLTVTQERPLERSVFGKCLVLLSALLSGVTAEAWHRKPIHADQCSRKVVCTSVRTAHAKFPLGYTPHGCTACIVPQCKMRCKHAPQMQLLHPRTAHGDGGGKCLGNTDLRESPRFRRCPPQSAAPARCRGAPAQTPSAVPVAQEQCKLCA